LDKLLKGVIDANFPLKELRAKRSTEVVLFAADKVERGAGCTELHKCKR